MRTRQPHLIVLFALLVAAAPACVDKKPETTRPAPSATAAPSITVTAFVTADAAPPDPRQAPQLATCPNAVESAMTSIVDVPGGVEVRVVSKDLARATEIRRRAYALVEAAAKGSPSEAPGGGGGATATGDAGGGTHGGHGGGCPVLTKNTVLSQLAIGGGAKITVKAKDPGGVAALRKETRDRQTALDAHAGPGSFRKASLCPSTVPATQTRVVNTATGVDVIVTSDVPASVEQIRSRGKECVARASEAPGNARPDGFGGALGRCPVVTQHVVLAAKDTAGGAVFTILPKAGPASALQAEAKRRFEKLGPPEP